MSDPDAKTSTFSGTDASAFEEAYRGYIQNLQEVHADLAKQLQDEHQNCLKRLSELQLDLQKNWSEAEQEYARTLLEAAGHEDRGKLREASSGATRTAQHMQAKFQEDMTQVHQQYAEVQQQAWEEARNRGEEAFRDYVRALKSAWEQVDPDSFDPRMVALVGQSMLAVAFPATTRLSL